MAQEGGGDPYVLDPGRRRGPAHIVRDPRYARTPEQRSAGTGLR